ncbi:hypothetical protein LK07_20975 [Streptomyces pluripotens]|uniref:Sensor domain-containing protein n=1 Tax=Streptomyces pluripotens TaxID=1355015 RepID=A0A221P1P5_9ACTN|nr:MULTISPECIES: hypothetical protein [Streptomyces]ARP71822.1 hypothetical protein LK06_019815 [Streptomyces pluripotens]ASN26072.1 hypothetical protein LK07_20975 [Streptomyces pluripotens]KIE26236.1 hypothetical protein LK08_13520 [Streptomyces sp. MUSC 125]MCH0556298.1 hypothetical protein [Streptomyces sp. MUM 16J]
MHLPSRVVTLLAVAALPLALSACSPFASKPAKDPNAGLLTGTQLKTALAPASVFPAGFTAQADGASDSGGHFLSPSAKNTTKPDCPRLEETSWIQASGYKGGVSFAQNEYMIRDKTQDMFQEIDEFQGTRAKKVMKSLRAFTTQCATFTDTDAHAKVSLTNKPTPGLGDEAFTITLKSGTWENGTTLIAVRSGHAVITTASTAGTDNGAATAKKMATEILGALQKKSAA